MFRGTRDKRLRLLRFVLAVLLGAAQVRSGAVGAEGAGAASSAPQPRAPGPPNSASAAHMLHIHVEAWRQLSHSYAVVAQNLLLALSKLEGVVLSATDAPFYNPAWQRTSGLFPQHAEEALERLPSLQASQTPDAVVRIVYPFQLMLSEVHPPGAAMFVYATAEWGACRRTDRDPAQATAAPSDHSDHWYWQHPQVHLLTPSEFSRAGLLACGVPPHRVHVLPNGVDEEVFQAPSSAARDEFRANMGWSEKFVYLNVGALTDNKGVSELLSAFAAVHAKYPHTVLVLKGSDHLYPSLQLAGKEAARAGVDLEALLASRAVQYIADPLSFPAMATLYSAADLYVSPYRAEGFNMPVLEAAACGVAVAVTRGGPTDEFTRPSFALYVNASLQHVSPGPRPDELPGHRLTWLRPHVAHLQEVMEYALTEEGEAFLQRAELAGPAFVHAHYSWSLIARQLVQVVRNRVESRAAASGHNSSQHHNSDDKPAQAEKLPPKVDAKVADLLKRYSSHQPAAGRVRDKHNHPRSKVPERGHTEL